jgi:hypothetical protein
MGKCGDGPDRVGPCFRSWLDGTPSALVAHIIAVRPGSPAVGLVAEDPRCHHSPQHLWNPPQPPAEPGSAGVDATLALDELIEGLAIRLVDGGVPQAVLDRYRSRGGAQSRGLTHPGRAAARKLHDAIDRLRLAHPRAIGPVGLSARTAVVHSDGALTLRVVRWRPRRLSCGHSARLIIDGPVPGSCNA